MYMYMYIYIYISIYLQPNYAFPGSPCRGAGRPGRCETRAGGSLAGAGELLGGSWVVISRVPLRNLWGLGFRVHG